MSRADKIAAILEARRPMAEKAAAADTALYQIEGEIRKFRGFIPQFAANLDADASAKLRELDPAIDHLLARLSDEKGKIALLAQRFSRSTLNIGVAGRAGQGKSTLLQSLTGLTTHEIPTGDKGHCTGAPSIIRNHESGETFAVIHFHTEHGFLEHVVAPFFQKLKLGPPPLSLSAFASSALPDTMEGATEKGFLEKLKDLQRRIPEYRNLLDGSQKRINREAIRSHVAQEDASGQKIATWIAVEQAVIHCPFLQKDVGRVALADTPGLGDFVSGAEERLAANVGSNLDAVLFVRKPPAQRAIIEPGDTDLYDLINGSIPELGIDGWSYFVINKSPDNQGQIDFFKGELRDKKIATRAVYSVNCTDKEESLNFLDEMLNDIARNLGALDRRLFDLRMESLQDLRAEIVALADLAATALPAAGIVQPDLALLNRLFGPLWENLGHGLKKLVDSYRAKRNDPDDAFLQAVGKVFDELAKGPGLPEADEIDRQAAAGGLMKWQADKFNELRVKISNAFELIDTSLQTTFDQLRQEALGVLMSDQGGKLNALLEHEDEPWKALAGHWGGHDGEVVMVRAIDLLVNASLSFRGFIQPRVRRRLDVLDTDDTDSQAASPYSFAVGDSSQTVKDKLEFAWGRACYRCRAKIEKMAKEPAMARFAAIEDFREAILHSGGETKAKETWHSFYNENRADVWPDEFGRLEGDTRLRKEWENAVQALKESLKQQPV